MSKINILSKDIYNKIAAGEVVEKPASVVKELVENSIDAGATNITIEVLDGGITEIKVMDNGSGIELDDFDKVFLAHATSKVKSINDLSTIGTLGFRGEALSSIASVSKVTLSSKTEADSEGHQVKCIGGELQEITPIGLTTGTCIVVDDLFFNIPARKKFLKKPKLEESETTNYVSRLILANPNISIKYICDNKIVFQSFGTGLYDAIYSIYGKSIVDNIFEVNFKSGDYAFSGFICKPTFTKPNRTYQTLIINGRYVINQSISTAIYKAYENFMMKGNFPFFVLNLNIPLDKVDVNVHPNKLEVKFENSNEIFGIVYSNVSDILYKINNTKTISETSDLDEESNVVDAGKLTKLGSFGSNFDEQKGENSDEIKEVSLFSDTEYESNKEENELREFKENIEKTSNATEKIYPIINDSVFDFKVCKPNNSFSTQSEYTQNINNAENSDIINTNNGSENHTKSEFFSKIDEGYESNQTANMVEKHTQDSFLNNNYKIVGVLFNTYILIEKDDKLLLIDQHAGHERLLYDKFNIELSHKQVATQPLLMPYVLETNFNETAFINENVQMLKDMGFEIEEFGINSFKVSSIPVLFDNIRLDTFFSDILSDLDSNLVLSKNNTLKDFIAKKACKSAVKGNDKLENSEIDTLISMINKEGQVLLCPHGRPIAVEVSRKEIEKWFKRIV